MNELEKPKPEAQTKLEQQPKKGGKVCAVPSCGRKVVAKNLCNAHYTRIRLTGNLQPERPLGEKRGKWNANWSGGETIKKDGRVLIFKPDHKYASKEGYVLRYRLVMEEKLGRLLDPDEIVHHINEINDDDRPDNLQVMDRVEHALVHRLNTKAERPLTFNGESLPISKWADKLGVNRDKLYKRLRLGWSLRKTLTTP